MRCDNEMNLVLLLFNSQKKIIFLIILHIIIISNEVEKTSSPSPNVCYPHRNRNCNGRPSCLNRLGISGFPSRGLVDQLTTRHSKNSSVMNLLNMARRLNNTDYQKGIGNGKLQGIKIE